MTDPIISSSIGKRRFKLCIRSVAYPEKGTLNKLEADPVIFFLNVVKHAALYAWSDNIFMHQINDYANFHQSEFYKQFRHTYYVSGIHMIKCICKNHYWEAPRVLMLLHKVLSASNIHRQIWLEIKRDYCKNINLIKYYWDKTRFRELRRNEEKTLSKSHEKDRWGW